MDVDTRFQAASISKPVSAMAALYFVEQGKLALDEDVNRRLVSWKVPQNEYTKTEKVTLRRILSHSAGLTVHGVAGYSPGAHVLSLIDILNGEKGTNSEAVVVDFVPASKMRYSGGGFCLLQQLLVDVGGKCFPTLMQEAKAGLQRGDAPGRVTCRNNPGYWLFGSNGVGRKNAQSVGTFLEPF